MQLLGGKLVELTKTFLRDTWRVMFYIIDYSLVLFSY